MKKKNLYTGLSNFATESTGGALTLEAFEKSIAYIQSDEFKKIEDEKMRFRAIGEIVAGRAYAKGLITPYEYAHVMATININGGLIVSAKMFEKLKPVAEEVEKEMQKRSV